MQVATLSISSYLQAKVAAALKGAVSISSTSSDESNKPQSEDDEVQCIGIAKSQELENWSDSESEIQVNATKRKGGTLNYGKKSSSRVKKPNSRFTIPDWKATSNNKRQQATPAALSAEWQSAITEWESLSMSTYHREKGEKLKTLQTKIKKLKKNINDNKRDELSRSHALFEKDKKEQEEKKRQKEREQELENEIERLKRREREREKEVLDECNKNDTTKNTNRKVEAGKTEVQKTTEGMIDILKGASNIKKIIYKSDKEEAKQKKNLALKQNDMEALQLGHGHEMAIMHADQRMLLQSYNTPHRKAYPSERERNARRDRSRSRSWSKESDHYYYSRYESELNKASWSRSEHNRSDERDPRSHRSHERRSRDEQLRDIRSDERDFRSHSSHERDVDQQWSRDFRSNDRGRRSKSSDHRSHERDIDEQWSRDIPSSYHRDRRSQSNHIDGKRYREMRSDDEARRSETNHKRREREQINERVHGIRSDEHGRRTESETRQQQRPREQSCNERTDERGHCYKRGEKNERFRDTRSDGHRGHRSENSHNRKRSREVQEKYLESRYDWRGHRNAASESQFISYEIKNKLVKSTELRNSSKTDPSYDSSSGSSSTSASSDASSDSE